MSGEGYGDVEQSLLSSFLKPVYQEGDENLHEIANRLLECLGSVCMLAEQRLKNKAHPCAPMDEAAWRLAMVALRRAEAMIRKREEEG